MPGKKIVCFGEILWDILPDKALPGGAPMNVAYHLHQLGEDPVLITRIGVDDKGKELLDILAAKNIDITNVQLDYDHPTGIVHATANEHGEMSYDIVSPAAWDHIVADETSVKLVSEADHFVFGSLSTRSKISRDALMQLLEVAKTKVLDINLRPPHFNRSIVSELLGKADIVKMNISELELVTGWFAEFTSTEERIALLQDSFHIPAIIVTMGGNGAIINWNGMWHQHPGYKVTVADTIGAGDSFLAALLSKTIEGKPIDEALDFASALGALVASKPGGWPQYELNDIINLGASKSTQHHHHN